MDLNAKTSCEKCGVVFMQSTANRTGGYCRPCYQRMNAPEIEYIQRKFVRAEVNRNTLLIAGFFPGFAEDLTFWQSEILNNGQLRQFINWHNCPNKQPHEIIEKQFSEKELKQIQQFINQIHLTGIELAESYFIVCDAPTFELAIPAINFKKSLVAIDFFMEQCASDEFALQSVQTYFKLWNYIDSLSPYRLKQHFAKK